MCYVWLTLTLEQSKHRMRHDDDVDDDEEEGYKRER
jgi:hypothetical protein